MSEENELKKWDDDPTFTTEQIQLYLSSKIKKNVCPYCGGDKFFIPTKDDDTALTINFNSHNEPDLVLRCFYVRCQNCEGMQFYPAKALYDFLAKTMGDKK